MKTLLELRKKLNAKRPRFRHYDHQKRKEVGTRWRRPRGLHNKMRKGVWGRPATVNVGYRNPVLVRGLSQTGLVPVLVHALSELESVDSKKNGVILAHVGSKQKSALLHACKKKGVVVLNVKNVDEEIKSISEVFAARKESKKELLKLKESKVKPVQKKAETKVEEKSSSEEKKEMDKVLTKRE